MRTLKENRRESHHADVPLASLASVPAEHFTL